MSTECWQDRASLHAVNRDACRGASLNRKSLILGKCLGLIAGGGGMKRYHYGAVDMKRLRNYNLRSFQIMPEVAVSSQVEENYINVDSQGK